MEPPLSRSPSLKTTISGRQLCCGSQVGSLEHRKSARALEQSAGAVQAVQVGLEAAASGDRQRGAEGAAGILSGDVLCVTAQAE